MRWDYNVDYRDDFSKGVHRDILIVPHATNVTKVSGGPPSITSKVPVFNASGQPTSDFQDVDWVIDNSLIVKEKFKYSYSLNPNDNISFSCAASAMVQFTIRNDKEYNEETNRWEQTIPNLQYYAFKDNHNNLILGELDGNYIIEVYTYINGDSDTLLYLGMFRVEEDKAVDNGYNRQITAYDFMTTFRDMDIFNWYKRLFTGINKLDNDYVDATNKTGTEVTKPDNYDDDVNWIRKKKSKWTVKDALEDLINNLAAYDMIVYNDDGSVAVGCTNTNPSTYGREYGEGNGYSGLGMPVMLDPQILDPNSKEYYPTEAGEGEYENYGYMKILELEFMENPSIMSSGSLSMGKFLEDIGVLAGRYPVIRRDYLYDDNYHDPSSYGSKDNKYNNYEKCILTFKPLPSSKKDKNIEKVAEQCFTNNEIVKGFEHSQFSVKDMLIVKIYINGEEKPIEFKQLTKKQRKEDQERALQTFSFSGNLFCSYLVLESDDEEIKKNISEYKKIREKLFGKEEKNHNMSSGSLFQQGFDNIKNRSYVPFKLTTFGDPCRDVGDRIKISFTDKMTGETNTFYSYIFERTLEGVQKMMDTYETKGQMTSPTFSNYQTNSTYESGFGHNVQMLGYKNVTTSLNSYNYVTPSDLVQYFRNIGIQLLDEPLVASAKFIQTGEMEAGGDVISYHHIFYDDGVQEHNRRAFVDKGYFDANPNRTTISIFTHYYDGGWQKSSYMNYEAQDLDLVEEYKTEDLNDDWYNCASWVFYQGRWYQVEDLCPDEELHPYDEYWFVNIIANEGYRTSVNDDYVTEGLNSLRSYDNSYDNPQEYEYCSTYDVIKINGTPTQVHFGDGVINVSSYEPIVYMPPGIWRYCNFCGTDGFDVITLGANYHFNYIGTTTTALTDGDTRTTITIDYSWTGPSDVTVHEYDQVDYNGSNFIFFDGIWHNAATRANIIITIPSTMYVSDFDNYPELKEIVVYSKNNQEYVDTNRLIGVDLNQITINGIVRDIQPFDVIKLLGYHDSYIYSPLNVWTSFNHAYDTGGEGLIGCDQCTVPVRSFLDNRKRHVEIKWKDPVDIIEWEPKPATWDHTVIVRKEDEPPKHRWDGVEIVDSSTRDEYETDPYIDEEIELNKIYYYGFFPYYYAYNKDGHAINFYRFTKSIKVDTSVDGNAPVINNITLGIWDGSETEFAWSGDNKMTVEVDNDTITFRMYIGNSVIYSFDAAYGDSIEDVSKINMGFLIDETNQIAKPSFTYKTDENEFSYNQESPTNSQMQDIYTWLGGSGPGPSPVSDILYQPYLNSSTRTLPIKQANGGVINKTITEIMNYLTTNDIGNCFFVKDAEFSAAGVLIFPLWINNNITDLYIGDRTLYDLDAYPIWIKTDAVTKDSRNIVIYCNANGDFTIYTNMGNLYVKTINSIEYFYVGSSSNTGGVGNYATLYLNKTYDRVYINGQLQS